MRVVCIAGLWLVAFCGLANAADGAMDSVEGERLDRCVERAVLDFRYDYDHPERTTTDQAGALFRARCGDEIAAYRAKLTPAEAGDAAAAIVSPAYDDSIDLMFHNLGFAARIEQMRPVGPGRGATVLRAHGRYAGFASDNALSDGEVMIVHRKDAFKYGSEVSWAGTIAGARYIYRYTGEARWLGYVEGRSDSQAGIICGSEAERAKCIVTLYGVRGWLKPVLEIVGRGSPFRVDLVCGPGSAYLLFGAGASPSPYWPDVREMSVALDDGTRVAFPNKCIEDREQKLLAQILASPSLRGSYVTPPRKTPFTIDATTADIGTALTVAGHLSLLASDSAATARAWSSAEAAERTVAPFSLWDALSLTREWQGALGCLVRGSRAVPIRAGRGREGACAHWIESLKWRAELLELQFPAPPPEGTDLDAERAARRKQSEVLVRATAAHALSSRTMPQRAAQLVEGELAASVMGRPGRQGFGYGTGRALDYGYAIGDGTADGVVPGAFGRGVRNTTVHCVAKGACTVRLPVADRKTLIVTTDGSVHGSSVCMDVEPGTKRDGWMIRGWNERRYALRDGCIAGDAGPALESIASYYGATVVHRSEPHVHWRIDGPRAEVAMGLAEHLADRLAE